ncbi:MAG: hypothetical protein ACTSYB_09765 [Candidatus Helarchaeota archaeon]
MVALQVAPIYLFFPLFATGGMFSDRILTKDLLKASKELEPIRHRDDKSIKIRLCKEDYIRIGIIIVLLFISLPWIAARLGLFLEPYDSTYMCRLLFFQPVHIGENHGWIGVYMLLSIILISKTEKLYIESIFKELSILLLCFLALWGIGLVIHDFVKEQFNLSFPFYVWGSDINFLQGFFIQILIILVLALIIYYLGWRGYYRLKFQDN